MAGTDDRPHAAYPKTTFRRVLVPAVVLASLVAATSHGASSTSVSPCRQVSVPTWSPDGKQIAFYGKRWPPPSIGHRNPNDILQAFCVANADGTNAHPVRYTVCRENCPDPPYQLDWVAPNTLLALRDGDVLAIAPGSKPRTIAAIRDFSFAVNPTRTRLAAGTPECPQCSGPLTIISLPSGAVVGHVGGTKIDNVTPSLSPDGTRVAFGRHRTNDAGTPLGIWTADVNGSGLRRLTKAGEHPLWSPTAARVAYLAAAGTTTALRVVAAGGGKSRALVLGGVQNVFGWSPDGRSIAFETGIGTFGKLAVVDAATGRVRQLLPLDYAPVAVWSPDSRELLAYSLAQSKKCWSLSRVPVDGSASKLVSSCTS